MLVYPLKEAAFDAQSARQRAQQLCDEIVDKEHRISVKESASDESISAAFTFEGLNKAHQDFAFSLQELPEFQSVTKRASGEASPEDLRRAADVRRGYVSNEFDLMGVWDELAVIALGVAVAELFEGLLVFTDRSAPGMNGDFTVQGYIDEMHASATTYRELDEMRELEHEMFAGSVEVYPRAWSEATLAEVCSLASELATSDYGFEGVSVNLSRYAKLSPEAKLTDLLGREAVDLEAEDTIFGRFLGSYQLSCCWLSAEPQLPFGPDDFWVEKWEDGSETLEILVPERGHFYFRSFLSGCGHTEEQIAQTGNVPYFFQLYWEDQQKLPLRSVQTAIVDALARLSEGLATIPLDKGRTFAAGGYGEYAREQMRSLEFSAALSSAEQRLEAERAEAGLGPLTPSEKGKMLGKFAFEYMKQQREEDSQ